ncbi:hypothetical protein BV898_12033 [Hypsibius exemplaris]|uniref:Uncharacterized protein n=1 Tax=Hypsibius exemplaris TaxID=2072580 RepID=A0A1W0WEW7_HYPEX|nr:hypothetical protein BV898_12033 [Hypsibius exemplaris]
MKAAFLPTFLLELALLSWRISAAPVPANEVCTLDGYQFKCQNGVWPRDKDMTFPAVTDQTTALHFEKFTFHEENLRPLPAVNLTNLGILTFDNVTVWNSAGKSVGLPLQQLTQRLNRVSVTTLRITDTEVGVLDASYFTGFRGLLSLSIKYCTVESVTPDAFQPLRLEGGGSVLTELQFSANKGVKTFPWDAIVPVAPSIRVSILPSQNHYPKYGDNR